MWKVCVPVRVNGGAAEGAERLKCFLTAWPGHRARDVPAIARSTIPAKSSPPAPPGRPSRPARGQQHRLPPLSFSPLPRARLAAPRLGVRCGLCLEVDVIYTLLRSVPMGDRRARFSCSSRLWGMEGGLLSPSTSHQWHPEI